MLRRALHPDFGESVLTAVVTRRESVEEFAILMSILWNQRAGRAFHADDREFPEHIDLGGES